MGRETVAKAATLEIEAESELSQEDFTDRAANMRQSVAIFESIVSDDRIKEIM